VNELRDKKFKGGKVVGWIHTHPSYGIKLSDYDIFIQQNFFSNDYEVAYVVDQLDGIEGFYFWINGELQHCKGFYIYDKLGVEIKIEKEKDDDADEEANGKVSTLYKVALGILAAAVVILGMSTYSLNSKLKMQQEQQVNFMNSVQQNLLYMQQQMSTLQSELNALKPVEETTEETTEESTDGTQNVEKDNKEGETTNE
jgi:hypothetical protein